MQHYQLMQIDPNNKIIRQCAEGMEAEGRGNIALAQKLFQGAWEDSNTDFEKFIAAHYQARNKADIQEELKWNLEALRWAALIPEDGMKVYFPSLHLSAGQSYEKLDDKENAELHYKSAATYLEYLPNDGYGNMIRNGIVTALGRFPEVNLSISATH